VLQYFIYFLVGGTVVAVVAYVGTHGNGLLAALVASLPVLFLVNILLLHHNGGMAASITYAKGALLFLPAYAGYAALTWWLLPRVGVPEALLLGLPVYLLPVLISRMVHRKVLKTKAMSIEAAKEVGKN